MPETTFLVIGEKELHANFSNYSKAVLKLISASGKNVAEDSAKILRVYPAIPRGSTYKRTGRLGRSWRTTKAGQLGWRLSNDAAFRGRRYGKYPHGNAQGDEQVKIHVGRWKLMRKVVDQRLVTAHLNLVKEIDSIAARHRLGK